MSIFLVASVWGATNVRSENLDEEGQSIVSSSGPYVPQQIIVRLLPQTLSLPGNQDRAALSELSLPSELDSLMRKSGVVEAARVYKGLEQVGSTRTAAGSAFEQVFLLSFDRNVDVLQTVADFAKQTSVYHSQPNYTYTVGVTPSDPNYPSQWNLEQSTDEDIDAEGAWDIEKGDYSVKIGIVDTGIDYRNKDLGSTLGSGRKVGGGKDYDDDDADPMDEHYHGTHVAGIAAALTQNVISGSAYGLAGVAGGWNYDVNDNTGNKGAQLIALKVGDRSFATDALVDAITEACDPSGFDVDVINASFSGPSYNLQLRSAVNYCARKGRVFVAAEGNQNTSVPRYPSNFDRSWVISVGASGRTGTRASFSNYGDGIDVVAPGVGILSTTPIRLTSAMTADRVSKLRDSIDGTSMAAPHVSGLAALMLSKDSSLHPEDVQGIIRASADDKGASGYDIYYGSGRINAERALEYMKSPWALNHYTASGGSSVSNTGNYKMTVSNPGGGLGSGTYLVKRYDVRKTVSLVGYSGTPYVWGRGVNETTGWSGANPNHQAGYCKVVSSTATTAELKTFVYKVRNLLGQNLGWYPSSPSNAVFAYSVLGQAGAEKAIAESDVPSSFALLQNHPNPFNSSTSFPFSIPARSHVAVDIYDVLGQHVRRLVSREVAAGWHQLHWDSRDESGTLVASGTYIYTLRTGGYTARKKMTLIH